MSSGKVILGVLAGVAAGAMLGILFAPDKGWNTRKRISKKGEDLIEDLKEKFKAFLDDFSEKIEEVEEEVSDFADPGTSKPGKKGKDVRSARV